MHSATLTGFLDELTKVAVRAADVDDVASVLRSAMKKHVEFDRMAGAGQLDEAGQAAMRHNQKRMRVLQQMKRGERDAAPDWVMDPEGKPTGMHTTEMNAYADRFKRPKQPHYGDESRPPVGSGVRGYDAHGSGERATGSGGSPYDASGVGGGPRYAAGAADTAGAGGVDPVTQAVNDFFSNRNNRAAVNAGLIGASAAIPAATYGLSKSRAKAQQKRHKRTERAYENKSRKLRDRIEAAQKKAS